MERDDLREMPRADLVRVDIAKLEAKVDVHFATLGTQLASLIRDLEIVRSEQREDRQRLDLLWDWRNNMQGGWTAVKIGIALVGALSAFSTILEVARLLHFIK